MAAPKPLRVLFFSDGDSCRGPLAAAFLRVIGGDGVTAESAGVTAAAVLPEVVRAAEEAGIDLRGHVPRAIADLGPATFDLVVTLGERALDYSRRTAEDTGSGAPGAADRARNRLFVGVPVHLRWAVAPVAAGPTAEESLAACRSIRDDLRDRARALVEHGYLAALARQRTRLDRLLDGLDEGVIVHDAFRRIYLFNRAAARITGARREDVLGHDCHEVFRPGGLCGAQCRFCNVDALPTEPCSYRTTCVTPAGETRRVRVAAAPVTLDDTGVRGVIATIRDDTEVDELRWRLATRRSFHGMVGISPPMQEVFETVRQAAAADYPVLISGESGTGKELVANAIHNESRRQGGPFVPVSCGALPETILESELFGHVRGAFTGAVRDKKGRFELADGGTLFLDEVGELSPAMQVKLLRVLQEKRFEKVGGEKTIQVDVRIVAATNRDLRQMVRQGTFREDLFYRLCVVPLRLPALRDRREDIPFLVEQVLETIRQESGKAIRGVADEAMDLLVAHRWPGNVRELINALQYASVRCTGDTIRPSHLPPEVRREPDALGPAASPPPSQPPPDRPGPRGKLDRAKVDDALQRAGGNKVRAARLLGVGRATLYRFLRREPA